MSQQSLGALALVALGVFIVVGAGGAALRRSRAGARHSESWPGRLLATLATIGLAAGFVALGAGVLLNTPRQQPSWPEWIAIVGFSVAILGYAGSLAPSAWRVFWAD